jgi:hypothetical protein
MLIYNPRHRIAEPQSAPRWRVAAWPGFARRYRRDARSTCHEWSAGTESEPGIVILTVGLIERVGRAQREWHRMLVLEEGLCDGESTIVGTISAVIILAVYIDRIRRGASS